MQNRRSFFGAIVGGIAAYCGISRQSAANLKINEVNTGGLKNHQDWLDLIFLGEFDGELLWSCVGTVEQIYQLKKHDSMRFVGITTVRPGTHIGTFAFTQHKEPSK